MFSDSVDLGDRRAGVYERAVSGDEVGEGDFVVERLLGDRGTTAAQQKNHKRGVVLCRERLKHGVGGAERLMVWLGMSAEKIAEAALLRRRLSGGGDDTFEAVPGLRL